MAVYNPNQTALRQDMDWTCSINSAAWALESVGIPITKQELGAIMVNMNMVSPELGLHDGSGGQLSRLMADISGLPAHNEWLSGDDGWARLQSVAGDGPVAMGSSTLYHWLAIRYAEDEYTCAGMNPAPGYRNVGDQISRADFDTWAPWAAIWLEVDPAGEDAAMSEELAACTTTVNYLMVDCGNELQKQTDALRAATSLEEVQTIVAHGLQPVVDTVKRGGAPAGI